jgi:single-stranded-DNA-specific exonuclease
MLSLTQKKWKRKGDFLPEKTLFQNFCALHNKTPENFSPVKFSDLFDPFLFNDAQKTVQIIFEAIEKNERILIFGDYDLDGMSGTSQLYLTLKMLGAQVSYRLPSREDGYGLSEKFVKEAHTNQVKVFITTDCGISNFSEISLSKKLGMTFIITDHHSIPEKIPPADAIWHPLLESETFPDKNLTGAGVAWYFCSALLIKKFGKKNARNIQKELLEHAVLGTVADCGPLVGENRKITMLGLQSIQTTKNAGLAALLKSSGTDPQKMTAESIAFFLGPRLNASGRLAHPHISLELLLGNPERAAQLETLNRERQDMVNIFLEEAEVQLTDKDERTGKIKKDLPALIISDENWLSGVIGLISGKLAEKYSKPVIAFAQMEDKFTGSCRGPQDFHIANSLKKLGKENPEWFLGYGGHAEAAGLSVKPEFFLEFCAAYQNEVVQMRGEIPPEPFLEYETEISRKILVEEIEELQKAQPFGIGNVSPSFVFTDLTVVKVKQVGKNSDHLSLFLQSNSENSPEYISGIFFQEGDLAEKITPGGILDVLAIPTINEWNNEKKISLQIKDLRESAEK